MLHDGRHANKMLRTPLTSTNIRTFNSISLCNLE